MLEGSEKLLSDFFIYIYITVLGESWSRKLIFFFSLPGKRIIEERESADSCHLDFPSVR